LAAGTRGARSGDRLYRVRPERAVATTNTRTNSTERKGSPPSGCCATPSRFRRRAGHDLGDPLVEWRNVMGRWRGGDHSTPQGPLPSTVALFGP
jgi:hypothetical protein